MNPFLRRALTFGLALNAVLFSGSACLDLAADGKKDYVEINQAPTPLPQQERPLLQSQQPETETSDGLEGAAKGVVALGSTVLLLFSQDKTATLRDDISESEENQIIRKVDNKTSSAKVAIPFKIDDLNLLDTVTTRIMRDNEKEFLYLLNGNLDEGIKNICSTDQINLRVKDGILKVVVLFRVLQKDLTEDMIEVIQESITEAALHLFLEKTMRISETFKDMKKDKKQVEFEDTVRTVVQWQIEELQGRRSILRPTQDESE